MEKVRIIFADGTEVEAERNGDSYIAAGKPDFPDDLSEVRVEGSEEGDKAFRNVQVVECASVDGRYWFALVETSEEALAQEKMDAQVLFTALMTDTLLEEG